MGFRPCGWARHLRPFVGHDSCMFEFGERHLGNRESWHVYEVSEADSAKSFYPNDRVERRGLEGFACL